MKLLVVGPDLRERSRIKNFTGVQAFYLCRELRRQGVQMQFVEAKPLNPLDFYKRLEPSDCDHVLCLGLRWITHQPVGLGAILKSKVKGALTQLHDGLVHEWLDASMVDVDCTFTFRDDSKRTKGWERYAPRYHYIGWAADPEVFYPEQQRGELRILIDHPYYKQGTPDLTAQVTYDAVAFAHTARWKNRFKSVRVRRLINGGAEDVLLQNVKPQPFTRQHIPLELIAPEYRRTYVYLPTHKESVGLTCLETAMCGALVVVPKGLVYQDRLDTIRHLAYDGTRAPWKDVLDRCDFKASQCKAMEQTWPKVAERLLRWFGDYK